MCYLKAYTKYGTHIGLFSIFSSKLFSKIRNVVSCCPGFSWDRVNRHKQLAGLTQTASQMGYSIPGDAMLSI